MCVLVLASSTATRSVHVKTEVCARALPPPDADRVDRHPSSSPNHVNAFMEQHAAVMWPSLHPGLLPCVCDVHAVVHAGLRCAALCLSIVWPGATPWCEHVRYSRAHDCLEQRLWLAACVLSGRASLYCTRFTVLWARERARPPLRCVVQRVTEVHAHAGAHN